jgi:hypothetical protein
VKLLLANLLLAMLLPAELLLAELLRVGLLLLLLDPRNFDNLPNGRTAALKFQKH